MDQVGFSWPPERSKEQPHQLLAVPPSRIPVLDGPSWLCWALKILNIYTWSILVHPRFELPFCAFQHLPTFWSIALRLCYSLGSFGLICLVFGWPGVLRPSMWDWSCYGTTSAWCAAGWLLDHRCERWEQCQQISTGKYAEYGIVTSDWLCGRRWFKC